MDPTLLVITIFVVGLLILIAEIFIPSHGLLSVVGLGFIMYAIFSAYQNIGDSAGHISILAALILLPTLAMIAVKTFHRTPWGRKLAPANPVARSADFAPHFESLKQYVGQCGRTTTPLRPVGTCIFNGERVNCVAESGMIDPDTEIEATGVRGREVEVRPLPRA